MLISFFDIALCADIEEIYPNVAARRRRDDNAISDRSDFKNLIINKKY
jgi:hypothetical protein